MTDLADRRGLETEVYQPAEDSRLLARTVVSEVVPEDTVLDVGCGSGFVAEHVRESVGGQVIGADVNPHACKQTAARGIPTVRADLVTAFDDRVFDVVLFNPPYLPTAPEVERGDWMEVALSGGPDGRAVIERFVSSVGRVLRPSGWVGLLVSSLTGVDDVVEVAGDHGFSAVALADESYPFETLTVLKLFR